MALGRMGRVFAGRSRLTVQMLRRTRPFRSAGPGRPAPPTSRAFGRRRIGAPILRYRRLARGGFFKNIVKGVAKVVKSVTKVPVIGAIAKAAVQSLPIVGQVTTAVAAFKGKTAVGVAASPVGGVQEPPLYGGMKEAHLAVRKPRRRRKTKKAKKAKRSRGGGSAKQRAARARFAAAARKGRIKKGTRL